MSILNLENHCIFADIGCLVKLLSSNQVTLSAENLENINNFEGQAC